MPYSAGFVKGIIAPSSILSDRIETRCDRAQAQFELDRDQERKDFIKKSIEFSTQSTPVEHTDIVDALVEIIRTRCERGEICKLYIFSNLLDSNAKKFLYQDTERLYKSGAAYISQKTSSDDKFPRIYALVWGFGFNDADGDKKKELADWRKMKIIAFWKGVFSVISLNKISITFEVRQ